LSLQTPQISPQDLCAAIDLGSNTCRLLIAEVSHNSYKVIDSFSRIIRLSDGVKQNGEINQKAMDRAIKAIIVCAQKIWHHQPKKLRCVATEACRQAQNAPDFLEKVQNETGLEFEIISTAEEAHLSLLGCSPLVDPKIPYAISFDIGGGSTEILFAELKDQSSPHIVDWTSLPYGVVNLFEIFGPDCRTTFDEIRHIIRADLEKFSKRHVFSALIENNQLQMIGCSGTATTIAALSLELRYYNRTKVDGLYLYPVDIEKARRIIWGLTPEEQSQHPCIGAGRANLVIPGLAIFASIQDLLPIPKVRVADRGVRDGILMEFMKSFDSVA
jgi:exopolyphosphatase/guanosine-5'-triphosphate,3'-diphosphate pyrophosphatase